MSRIVRSSKYRHVFGTPCKKENGCDNLRVSKNAWDSNFCAANPLFWAVIWDAGGGGAFAVAPWEKKGKWASDDPIVSGHKSAVLDIDFNPFNDHLIASVSEDCTGKIWGIPEGGLKENLNEPLQTLSGHKRKVGCVKFNPVANNILATASTDYMVKVWDIESGDAQITIDGHADIIQSIDWNYNGSLLATSCKDKKIRVCDPRSSKIAHEADGHAGVKGSRVCWLGEKEKLFSVGFTKTSEREYAIWDPKDMSKPLVRSTIDTSSGIIMPFFDPDTNVLFLAGKGDGNIRYYEIVDDKPWIHGLSEFKSSSPSKGMCIVPKRAMNVSDCEIVRLCKLNKAYFEPISFTVPRKSDVFQDDIFPPCYSGEASLSSSEWLGGKDAPPKKASLEGGFVKKEAVAFNPTKKEEAKPLSEKEMKDELEKMTKRVAYLEAELIKRDAKIKELS